ncbi:MAG TPA: kelch repeat-containing protein [Kofleriaceae bacterium]|nr:kelch repeat-containing protein [Kofleriaceae bacterium]
MAWPVHRVPRLDALRDLLTAALVAGLAACAEPPAEVAGDSVEWSARAPIASGPRLEAAVVAHGGLVYVIGGFDSPTHVTGAVAIYDPATDAWREGARMPQALHHVSAVAVGGRVVVTGGLRLDFSPTGVVAIYDPAADRWESGAPMPAGTERGAAAVGVVGDEVMVAGGSRDDAVDLVSSYSPANDRWTERAPLPAAAYHGVAVSAGGALYVIGGLSAGLLDGSSRAMADVLRYDPDADAWVPRAPMPTPRGGCAAGVVDGLIVCAGGEADRTYHGGIAPETEAYDPVTDTWSALPPMRTPRGGTAGAAVDGRLYVPGGARKLAFAPLDVNEAFDPLGRP